RIGRDLAVDGVLEGTVQRLGARLRVTVQLVSVRRGSACWAESFQGDYDDLFEAQDAIAMAVVAGLRLTLTRQEEAGLTRHPTRNLDACRAYVRGRYFWNKRSRADLDVAIECFERATRLDPNYPQAYAGLADAWILRPFYGSARPAESFRQARDMARRALELDASMAEAHTSLAYTDFVYSRRWRTAEERFRQALSCNAYYATAHHWYGFLLTALGRHEEALEYATRAHELEPLSQVIHTDLALAYYFARDPEAARSVVDALVETDASFGYAQFALALIAHGQGQDAVAIAAARAAVECLEGSTAAQAVLGYVLAPAGGVDEARALLDTLNKTTDPDPADPNPVDLAPAAHRALIHLGLGEHDCAFEALAQACDERSNFAAFLGVWPIFDPLRPDPRFEALLRRIRPAPD
ncbi:MAG: tetratricopeptide repeat protein, partial [Acidobacteriota bacterium]